MNPQIAAIGCAIGILGLFFLYRNPKERTSKALWLPTIWILLASSRMVSVWLHPPQEVEVAASQLTEGSPLDRAILSTLLLAGLIVLLLRYRRLVRVLKMNGPILLFFFYCAVSSVWSPDPGLSFKRWFKAIGDLVMVLIILTDWNRNEAIKRIITRVGFLVVPLSVLMIEYYPSLGQMYSLEDGDTTITGVTTNKNMLGLVCMIVGLGFVWLLIKALRADRRRIKHLMVPGVSLAMVLWLLIVARSFTALACFLMGTALLVVVNMPGRERPAKVHLLVGSMLSGAAIMFIFPEIFVAIIHAFGKNTTLTGRTGLWKVLLAMDTHPWLGAGFESFWVGSRLNNIWSIFPWQPNEAHNGYLEVYLNLGIVGVSLLGIMLLSGYRSVTAAVRQDPEAGSLRLAYFTVALAYSFSEAGFRLLDPMWIFLLIAMVAVPYTFARKNQNVALSASDVFSPADLAADDEHIYMETT